VKGSRRGSLVSSGGRTATRQFVPSPSGVAPSHEAIARRAYLKWQARGRPSGTDLQDWLEAEAELKAELSQGRRG
jgi:Protein of unknown function (DUF2934)